MIPPEKKPEDIMSGGIQRAENRSPEKGTLCTVAEEIQAKKAQVWIKLGFWIIAIQLFAGLLPLSTRLPFPSFWTDWVPAWKKVNIAFEKLRPDEKLSEQFLGKGEAGFDELLGVIDRHFVELPIEMRFVVSPTEWTARRTRMAKSYLRWFISGWILVAANIFQ